MDCVAVIGKCFDTKTDFFKALKVFVSPEDVRAVHAVPAGLEITFFKSCKLQAFVENAPDDWKIISDCTGAKIVTLSPKIGTGHVLVPDRALWTCMERFGRVVEAKRNVWAEAEGFTVESGTISFKMELDPGVNVPSSLTFGRAGFGVSYKGQTPKCHNCQGSHMARNCKERVCYKCRGKGHLAKSCPVGHRCTVCWRVGHQYMYCPEQTKKTGVVIGREWSKRADPPYSK